MGDGLVSRHPHRPGQAAALGRYLPRCGPFLPAHVILLERRACSR